MFGLGFGEMAVIVILAIVVVGPERLPTLLKSVGGAMRQMRQASRDIRSSVGLDELMDLDDPKPKRPVARVRPPVDAPPVAQAAPPTQQIQQTPVAAPAAPIDPADSAPEVLSGRTPNENT